MSTLRVAATRSHVMARSCRFSVTLWRTLEPRSNEMTHGTSSSASSIASLANAIDCYRLAGCRERVTHVTDSFGICCIVVRERTLATLANVIVAMATEDLVMFLSDQAVEAVVRAIPDITGPEPWPYATLQQYEQDAMAADAADGGSALTPMYTWLCERNHWHTTHTDQR